jgi:hypothetical protein
MTEDIMTKLLVRSVDTALRTSGKARVLSRGKIASK